MKPHKLRRNIRGRSGRWVGWTSADVRRTVLRVKGQGLVAKEPKTRSGQRVLRIPSWLVTLLSERRSRLGESAGPVFPDKRGGYRDRNNIEADYRKVRQGTAFEWVVPHVYRKSVATLLDQGILSARMIADQLGHSRISMTQDAYMGRRAVDIAVASALEELLDVDEPLTRTPDRHRWRWSRESTSTTPRPRRRMCRPI